MIEQQSKYHRPESSDTIRVPIEEIRRLLAEQGETLKPDDDAPREPAVKP